MNLGSGAFGVIGLALGEYGGDIVLEHVPGVARQLAGLVRLVAGLCRGIRCDGLFGIDFDLDLEDLDQLGFRRAGKRLHGAIGVGGGSPEQDIDVASAGLGLPTASPSAPGS